MGVALDVASLLGLFLETLFYGVFLTLYWLMLFILLKKSGIQRQLIIPVATLLLCIATAHLIIDFVRALEAFVFDVHKISAAAYYSNLASPLELAKTALFITQPALADGILIWRCYVLNNKSLLVSISGCIVLLTNTAIGCYIVWSLTQAGSGSTVYTTAPEYITTFYMLTILISNMTTLIAWRIYRTRRPDGLAVAFLPVFIVIVESGALYSTSVIALLATFLARSNGKYPAMDIATPIVGIVFCLIILQVHFHVGGNPPTELPDFFRVRGVRDANCGMEPIIFVQ
ncbi:hypothetical protein K503DRAFT_693595 [Rhizopogon vinicolor AM-OR11-026]|uniref:Family A G protein-coupled receptor-like protein n=1 Tax=Rhizopogon vinicolor AM-OR11-026 TaxID=1314800 RepID=A0A1B7MXF2_9AGAM|nr:hypothetical protein K503DRAFT_693595 [Rhizopogon vinicolor AM-OR11-026]